MRERCRMRPERMRPVAAWGIRGSYFESCNCEAICPCRRIDGVHGGRSTYGECLGVLSWVIEQGWAADVSLDGFGVALATRYHDDEPGSPWRFVLYVDVRADDAQRDALVGIYTGRLGGDALTHFPWAWKKSDLAAIRPVEIEVSHQPRRQWLRISDRVSVRIREAYPGSETVTCVISLACLSVSPTPRPLRRRLGLRLVERLGAAIGCSSLSR